RPDPPGSGPRWAKEHPPSRARPTPRPAGWGLPGGHHPADTATNSGRRKLAYDLYYIRQMNLWLDMRLIASTALHVFGVPYDMLGRLFRLPGQKCVETAYQERVQTTGLVAPA